MAVVAVREINKGRDGGITREGDTEYVRVFLAKVDSPFDNAGTIMATGDIPHWLQIFSAGGVTDLSARVKDIRCKPWSDDSPYWWVVTVKYDSVTEPGEKLENPEGEQQEDNPLNRPPVERWETYRTTEIRQFDFAGEPYANSAGQLYEEGLEVEVIYPVLVIVRNEPTVPTVETMSFVDCINQDNFRDKGKYRWKVLDITSAEGQEQIGGFTIFYEQVRYEFALKDDNEPPGWKHMVLDKGPMQRRGVLVNNAPQFSLEFRRDANNAIIEKDELLDGAGSFVTRNPQGVPTQPPQFRRFFRNKAKNFSQLGL